MDAVMGALAVKAECSDHKRSTKGRGVRNEEKLKQLRVHTAKAVVRLDLQSRRAQGGLTHVALLPPDHAQLPAILTAGNQFNEAKESAKAAGNQQVLQELRWAHLHIWIGLVMSIVRDASIPDDNKREIVQRSREVTNAQQSESLVMVCQQRKAFNQAAWKTYVYRVELFAVPSMRAICEHMIECMLIKPNSVRKVGHPPRGPHVRGIVNSLVDMGEYSENPGAKE